MMFRLVFLLLLFTNICKGQGWQAEVMAGVSGYNGDLTQKRITVKQLRPALNLNIKYNSGNLIDVRAGIVYTRVGADDKNNTDNSLKRRNLNFKSDILELNIIGEINLFDPEAYVSYPYLFGGVGVFHFNPFTYDKNNKKTYLQPLGTEGQGLEEFPDRKKYSLIQLCLPVGIGWKWIINDDLDVSYELGYRILFTDYLDDVSKTYVNLDALAAENGPKSAELAYRGAAPFRLGGKVRGHSGVNDSYFFSGIKISTNLNSLFGK
jgi:Domain of unknown function (DUF6089)